MFSATAILLGGVVFMAAGHFWLGAAVAILGLLGIAGSILEQLYNNDLP